MENTSTEPIKKEEQTQVGERDFNGIVKGLFVFFLATSAINSVSKLVTNLTWGNTTLGIIMFICEAACCYFIYVMLQKKSWGLLALFGMLLLQIPSNLILGNPNMESVYISTFMRIGIFSLLLLIPKNKTTGWGVLFGKNGDIEDSEELPSLSNESGDDSSVKNEGKVAEVANQMAYMPAIQPSDVIEQDIRKDEHSPEPVSKVLPVIEEPVKEDTNIKQRNEKQVSISGISKWVKTGIITGAILVLGLLVACVIVASKDYPQFIEGFGNKWKYSFNLPNNELANSLMNEMESSRDESLHVVTIPGYSDEVLDATRFYEIRVDAFREYPLTSVLIATKQITDLSKIVSSQNYVIVPQSGEEYTRKGSDIVADWSFYGDTDSRSVFGTKPYDYPKALSDEMRLVDEAATLRVTDPLVIKRIGGYYEHEGNLSKAIDYYRETLKKDKNNTEVRGELAYALALNDDIGDAQIEANKALEKNPKELKALSALAILKAEIEDWSDVKKYAKRAIDYGAEDSNLFFAYCEALHNQGDIKTAQVYYNKAWELYRHNPRRKKYSKYAGCPFEVIAFHYGSSSETKTTIPYDDKLVSGKCYFIDFKLEANVLRQESCRVGVKLFKNGNLMKGNNSKDGFTYYEDVDWQKPGLKNIFLSGWGNNSGNAWPAGSYEIEVWYKGDKVAEDSFRVY